MVRSRSLAKLDLLSTKLKRNQRLSQNGPLDLDDTTNKEVPAQRATARDVTSEQSRDELYIFRVRFFELDDIGDEAIEGFDGVVVEEGVEVHRESGPVVRRPSVSGGYQCSIESVERGCELA